MAEIFNLPTKEQFDTMNANLANIANPASSNVNYINTTSGLLATNVQSAIDEIDEQVNTNKTDILSAKTTLGSVAMTTTAQTVTGAINELDADIGNKSTLATTDKSNLVNAVNETKAQINDLVADKADKTQLPNLVDISSTLVNGWVLSHAAENGLRVVKAGKMANLVGGIMNGTVTSTTQIGTLPEGFRPNKEIYAIAYNISGLTVLVQLFPSGIIGVANTGATWTAGTYYFNVTYPIV